MTIEELLAKPPSRELFGEILLQLEREFRPNSTINNLPAVLEAVATWPEELREAPPYWLNKFCWWAPDDQNLLDYDLLDPVGAFSLTELVVFPEEHSVSSYGSNQEVMDMLRSALHGFFEAAPEMPQLHTMMASFTDTDKERRAKLPGGCYGSQAYYKYAELEPWLVDDDIAALCAADIAKHVKKLDLSGNNKLELLPGLEKLRKLEELDLSFCTLPSLPANLTQLPNLKRIILRHAKIDDVTLLEQLTGLEIVNLGMCFFDEERPPDLSVLSELRELYLDRVRPKDLSWLKQCKKLEVLELQGSDEAFRDAKLSFRGLKKLRRLDASQCRMISLYGKRPMGPFDSIAKLPDLEELKLHMCSLERVPKNLATLPKLRSLDLSICEELEDLSGIGEVKSLERLDLSCCRIKKLPAEFAALTNLKWLDLTDHRLAKLDAFRGLKSLEEVNLRLFVENINQTVGKLKKLPDWFTELSSLRRLVLTNNQRLEDIEVLLKMDSLKHLDVRGCKALVMPPGLARSGLRIQSGGGVYS